MATFIYRHIYCRYLCPGECIVYDRGEFCNKIMDILNREFGAKIRVIAAARPQGNGQAEAFVKSLKNKMYALMVQGGSHCIPDVWDETLLHRALQIIRSDPSTATGYSPMELSSVIKKFNSCIFGAKSLSLSLHLLLEDTVRTAASISHRNTRGRY